MKIFKRRLNGDSQQRLGCAHHAAHFVARIDKAYRFHDSQGISPSSSVSRTGAAV